MDIGSGFLALPGIAMVIWAAAAMRIKLTARLLLGYIALLALMLLLLYNLVLLMRSAAFWFTRIESLGELEGELMGFAFRVPGIVFQGAMKTLLYVLLPYALLATIPTQFFTGILSGREWLSTLAVVAVFTCLAQIVWKLGLKRYESTGS
jgi:ABC-2 type transport system permease protein